jgi:hypothetical protein
MGRYNDLSTILKKKALDTNFEKLDDSNIQQQINENPNVPADYLDFLREIGYGDIGNDVTLCFIVD